MASNRRSFLKSAGAAAAVASAAPLGLVVRDDGAGTASAAPNQRLQPVGRQALELDGVPAGWLWSVEGGFPFGKVAEFASGSGGPPEKFISGVGVEDLAFEVDAGLAPVLREWVAEMVSGNASASSRKNGAIILTDHNYQVQNRLEFTGALITEVGFPALDGASKDPCFLRVVISPETSEYVPASGSFAAPIAAKQKKWVASNFRVKIGDLPTQRVAKVDAFVVKQKAVEFNDGTTRFPQKLPGKLELPNLAITFAASDSQPWFDYFKQFVLQGAGDEQDGELEYLAQDLSPLFTLELHNLGIFKCQTEQGEAAADKIARTTAELYVEGVALPAVQ